MAEPRTQVLYRFAAFIGGLVILYEAARVSFGLVLCAPLARYSATRSNDSGAVNAFTMVFGGVIAAGFLGNVFGTIGWIGTMLLVFSVTGRWLREAPVVAIESDVVHG
jgi:hypothetical protein